MIIFRLLDGVQAFDDLVFKLRATPDNLDIEHWAMWDDISRRHFGISYDETFYQRADEVLALSEDDPMHAQLWAEWEAHDSLFIDDTQGDPQILDHLKTLGVDFSPAVGRCMPSMLFFSRQAEAAAKGLLGAKLPAVADISEHLTRKLQADVDRFMRGKRGGGQAGG